MAMLVLLSRAMCCVESSSLDGGEPAGDHEGEQRTGRGHGKDCGEPGRGGTGAPIRAPASPVPTAMPAWLPSSIWEEARPTPPAASSRTAIELVVKPMPAPSPARIQPP